MDNYLKQLIHLTIMSKRKQFQKRNSKGRFYGAPRKSNGKGNNFTKYSNTASKGKTAFDAENQYDKSGKNIDKKQRNAPWKQMTYSTKDSADWRKQNSMQKGDTKFGKTAVVDGHLSTDENGDISRRQKYYDIRVGMGLVGG